MRVYETFGGSQDGNTVATTNTIFGSFTTTGTVTSSTFDKASRLKGNAAWKQVLSAATLFGEFVFPGGASANSFHSLFVNLASNPSAITPLMVIRSSTTIRAQVTINTTGHVQLRSPAVAVGSASTNVYTGGWLRIEWDCVGTVQTVRLFSGVNLFTDTPTETLSPGAGSITVSGHDRIDIGPNVATTQTVLFGGYVYDDTSSLYAAAARRPHRGLGVAA